MNRCSNFDPDDPLGETSHFDFDRIIPEPRTKEECPVDCLVTPDSHIMKDKERPWFNWYSWHIQHWDTKWNAYDGYTVIGKSYVQFVFSTAWSVPSNIYKKLDEIFNSYDMEVKWADEDLGNNCGKAVHYAGCDGWDVTWMDEDPHSRKFAKRIWDNY